MSSPWWTVPPLWRGRSVAILASGPGMSPTVAQAVRAAGVPAIAINSTWRLAPWADMLYAADPEWWLHPGNDALRTFGGLKVSCMPVPGVHRLRNTGSKGFDADPANIRTGRNSGYQALHIAAHTGAKRVLLCGYDMQGEHWHGKHPAPLRDTTPEMYATWRKHFAALAPVLAARGLDVVNCTPGSALACFRFSTLEAELAPRTQPAAASFALPA